jgi:hypothetical protein
MVFQDNKFRKKIVKSINWHQGISKNRHFQCITSHRFKNNKLITVKAS